MITKWITAALFALASGGAAQAQNNCPCNGGAGTLLATAAELQTLLAGKMVCASVGGEQWQEWHNGTSSGPVVDYKLGPGNPVDPPTTVGSYVILDAVAANISRRQVGRSADATPGVRYTYGADSYTYAVCQTGATYAFCGAVFGGRDITGAKVSATPGLQNCASVAGTAPANVPRTNKK